MMKYFIQKALGKRSIRKPRIAVCVPSGVTEVEKKAVEDATYQAGAREVSVIEEPIAAAIGAGTDGWALIADAVATCCGAVLGTSTVTTFVESSTGISEGARTGLSSLVVGVLFVVSILLAPIAGIIPSAATAPALIIVGVLMMKGAVSIDWNDLEAAADRRQPP